MAAVYSRHSSSRHGTVKPLPISLPSKIPEYTAPVSRVAISPPEYSDYSSSGSRSSAGSRRSAGSYSVGSRSSSSSSDNCSPTHDRHRHYDHGEIGEMLSDRMNSAFSSERMDRGLTRQKEDSGKLSAKEQQLRELQERARNRLKTARVNFAESVEDSREIRRDLDYCRRGVDSMKSRSERQHPDAYAKVKSRSRHAA